MSARRPRPQNDRNGRDAGRGKGGTGRLGPNGPRLGVLLGWGAAAAVLIGALVWGQVFTAFGARVVALGGAGATPVAQRPTATPGNPPPAPPGGATVAVPRAAEPNILAPGVSWPTYMGGMDRTGYTASAATLTPSAVSDGPRMLWRAQSGGPVFAQPTVAGGIVYWGSWDGYERATDAATGKQVWRTYLGRTVDVVDGCEPSEVGVASTATVTYVPINGRRTAVVLVGGGNATFYALNAATGAVVWARRLGSSPSTFLWSSPAVFAGNVYIGTASFGDCPLIQARVFKLSAATGYVEALFDLVPRGCVGASLWGSITIKPETGLLFFATGNQGPCAVDEPYAVAVVAMRASDFTVAGRWQVPLSEQIGDGDFGNTPVLFDATIAGRTRHLLGVGNKSGMFYVLDQNAVSRGPVWQVRVADVGTCAECGDGSDPPATFDGRAIYVPGGFTTINGVACAGGLRALNPATGAQLWARCLTGAPLAALTSLPGLVIVGEGATLRVVSTANGTAGRALWSFRDPHEADPWFYSPAAVVGGVIYVGSANGTLYALGG